MRLRYIALALALTSTLAAHADTFSYTITGGDTASGTFTTAKGNNGVYLVTGISGNVDGIAITSLLAPGSYAGNDNDLFFPAAGSTFFDFNGISFLLASGVDGNFTMGPPAGIPQTNITLHSDQIRV